MKLTRLHKIILSTTSILVILYLGISYYFSNQIVAFKHNTLEEDRISLGYEGLSDFNLPTPVDGSFNNDDVTMKYWYFSHPSQKKCGVILVHGFGRTRWGAIKFAPLFWNQGCSIFSFDLRRHGESSLTYGTFGYLEKDDLQKAFETFAEISKIPKNKIGVLGVSYGAATALQWAGDGAEPAFVIAESSYKDLDSIVGKRAIDLYGSFVGIFIPTAYEIAEFRSGMVIEDTNPAKSAENIKAPVLVIHSKSDEYTPYTHSEEIYKHIRIPEKELVITDWGAEHIKSIDVNYLEFDKIVNGFLKKFVPNWSRN